MALSRMLIVSFCAGALLVSCTSSPRRQSAQQSASVSAHNREDRSESGRIELPTTSLGRAVEALSRELDLNLVLMNGLQAWQVQGGTYGRGQRSGVVEEVARSAGCTVHHAANYSLIYPEQWSSVTHIDIGAIPEPFATRTVGMEFNSNFTLFNAFAAIGRGLELTVVVDNVVGEQNCGEIRVQSCPLPDAFTALLQSARVARFEVLATPDYVFVGMPGSSVPETFLLNASELAKPQAALLSRHVDVILPEGSDGEKRFVTYPGAIPLHRAAPALEAQLGLPLRIDATLRDVPINPVSMTNVSVQSALDLLLRQWPVRDVGYRLRDGLVVIERSI